jgi:hypothetical protein
MATSNTVKANARSAEQQAALDAMRANKDKAEVVQPVIAASAPEEKISESERIAAAVSESIMKLFGFGTDAGPSWKRRMVAFFATVMLAGGAGYAIGTLAGYCIVGIASLGGSMLWAYLIMVIALLLAAYAGMKIGQVVGNYVLSGQIDADIASVKNKVTGWFGTAKNKLAPTKLTVATVAPVAA